MRRAPHRSGREAAARSLDVCVIGAGLSGLVTIKELLDEGHRVTCFEREAQVGGNFSYPTGAAYDVMYLTTSQFFTAFSSLTPPLTQAPRYWSRREYAEYLSDFSREFQLAPHIRFGAEVLAVRRVQAGGSERLEVEHRDSKDGPTTTTAFDAIAICTGPHSVSSPRVPSLPGADRFRGRIEHATSYRSAEPYRGRHVVCLGLGETAADVAGQIADVAASCWVTFRRYPVVLKRWIEKGGRRFPNDTVLARLVHAVPRSVINRIQLRRARRILAAPPGTSTPRDRLISEWRIRGGTPGHQPLQKNDEFIDRILSGALQVRPGGIERLEEDAVVFADGSRVKADVVMCCTGFDENRPPVLIEGAEALTVRQLYKHAFHPDFGGRVAYIGWARPVQGGVPACSELQARYFALLCSGTRALPDRDALRRLIERDREREERSFHARQSVGTLCSYTVYLDSLAELIGCRPRLRDYLLEPRFLYRLLGGSNVAAAYRLRGPHAQPRLAKELILRLPVVLTPAQVAGFCVLSALTWIGVFREAKGPRDTDGRAIPARTVVGRVAVE